MPTKPILLAFLIGIAGGGTATLISTPEGLTFPEPAPRIAKALSPEAAARFEPLNLKRQAEYTHILFRGVCVDTDGGERLCAPRTHVRYSVPSLKGGPAYPGEHESNTRSETVPAIVALTEQVIFPAALRQCPDLADREAHPDLDLAHVDYVGVEGPKAVGSLTVPALLDGLPERKCHVKTAAPQEAFDMVDAMTEEHLAPEIRKETGLR